MHFLISSKTRPYSGFLKIDKIKFEYDAFKTHERIKVEREVLERGDSVAVLIYESDSDSILFTKQFRPGAAEKDLIDGYDDAGWLLEIPAGMIDVGEDPQQAAMREVQEELGYAISSCKSITQFYVSPGGSTERIFLYYADVKQSDKTHTGGGLQTEHEDIALIKIKKSDLSQAIQNGNIRDAKTMVALQWLMLHH